MNRFIMLLLCVFLFCVLSACGAPSVLESDSQTATPTSETQLQAEQSTDTEEELNSVIPAEIKAFQTLLGEYVNIEHYEEADIEIGEEYECSYSLKTEYRREYNAWGPKAGYITVGSDTKVKEGKAMVSDLLSEGWKFSSSNAEDSELGVNRMVHGYELVKDSKIIRLGIANETEEIIKLKDGSVTDIHLELYSCDFDGSKNYSRLSSAVDFDIDGKVTQDSAVPDMIAAFGEPSAVSYFSDSDRAYITITFGSLELKASSDGNTIYDVAWYVTGS